MSKSYKQAKSGFKFFLISRDKRKTYQFQEKMGKKKQEQPDDEMRISS